MSADAMLYNTALSCVVMLFLIKCIAYDLSIYSGHLIFR